MKLTSREIEELRSYIEGTPDFEVRMMHPVPGDGPTALLWRAALAYVRDRQASGPTLLEEITRANGLGFRIAFERLPAMGCTMILAWRVSEFPIPAETLRYQVPDPMWTEDFVRKALRDVVNRLQAETGARPL